MPCLQVGPKSYREMHHEGLSFILGTCYIFAYWNDFIDIPIYLRHEWIMETFSLTLKFVVRADGKQILAADTHYRLR